MGGFKKPPAVLVLVVGDEEAFDKQALYGGYVRDGRAALTLDMCQRRAARTTPPSRPSHVCVARSAVRAPLGVECRAAEQKTNGIRRGSD